MKIEEKIQNFAPVVITLESESEVVALGKALYNIPYCDNFISALRIELRKIEYNYIPF